MSWLFVIAVIRCIQNYIPETNHTYRFYSYYYYYLLFIHFCTAQTSVDFPQVILELWWHPVWKAQYRDEAVPTTKIQTKSALKQTDLYEVYRANGRREGEVPVADGCGISGWSTGDGIGSSGGAGTAGRCSVGVCSGAGEWWRFGAEKPRSDRSPL
jgi:hypothetical protein